MPIQHTLSDMYSARHYRAHRTRPVRWTRFLSKTSPWCDECFAYQYEHPLDRTRVRGKATKRRTIQDGPSLQLCGPHAALWKERDMVDSG